MMMGLGAGAWLPAVFHIFTHAFFKACLFLGAGSISHSASHHSFEMKKDMGGLRRFMPVTFATWIISTLALCGVFPFSGFFSKDEIIDNVGHNGYTLFMWIGLTGAFLTAAYMTRATYLTFFGEPRGAAAGEHHDDAHGAHAAPDDSHGHDAHGHDAHHDAGHDQHGHDAHHDAHAGPHESPALITVPLIILATLAIGSGLLNAVPFGEKFEKFTHWVEPRVEVISPTGLATVAGGPGEARVSAEEGEGEGHHDSPCGTETPKDGVCVAPQLSHAPFKWSKAALSMLIVLLGMVSSWVLCVQLYGRKRGPVVGLTERNKLLRRGHDLLVNKYYLDHLYENIVVRSIAHPIANAAYWVNQKILDGAVNGAGTVARTVSGWVYRNVDQRVVDGAVNGSGTATRGVGSLLRPVQSGKVNNYGALLFGTAAIAALVLVIINT
jgi:NADH-quinone oxidoreductase subunit L